MFSSSGAGNVDLTGYDNKKFTTSFPAWRSKTPTGGHIAFGVTQEGENGINNFDKVSVYCNENTHKNFSQGTNYLFKYAYGVDREDNKNCLVQFGLPEDADTSYSVDISEAVRTASGFWSYNGFNSIFGRAVTPEICKKTGTPYRITKEKKLFIIKDNNPLTWLCNEGYGCTL